MIQICLHQRNDSADIVAIIFNRVAHRFPDVNIGGEMHYQVYFFIVENFADQHGIVEVSAVEFHGRQQSSLMPVNKVVQYDGIVSGFD